MIETRKARPRKLITKGQINRIIDIAVHRHARRKGAYWLIDGLLHAVVEGDPERSLTKFFKYNLPEIANQLAREAKAKTHSKNP